jgi:hypothetical protein
MFIIVVVIETRLIESLVVRASLRSYLLLRERLLRLRHSWWSRVKSRRNGEEESLVIINM